MIRSRACTQDQFQTPEYPAWCRMMRDVPRYHRKQWEFVFVADALQRFGVLGPGKRGLGFAVGQAVWRAFATNLGAVPVSVVPVGVMAALGAGVLVVANLLAFAPAMAAARSKSTAQLLRAL